MIKLTEKQLDKVNSLIQGDIDLFDLDSRVYAKLEKASFIGVSDEEPEHTNNYIHVKWNHVGYYRYEFLTVEAIAYFADKGIVKQFNRTKYVCWKCDGKGYIREYGHVEGGVCFNCNGTGKAK